MHCALCHVLSATCTGRLGPKNLCQLSITVVVLPAWLKVKKMSLGSLVGQNYRNTHNKQHTQLLVIVRLPVVARKRLGTVY